MSEHRRLTSREEGFEPSDQKVWGPGYAHTSMHSDTFGVSPRRRAANQEDEGLRPLFREQWSPREEPQESAPDVTDERHSRRHGRFSELPADNPIPFEDPPRRRRRTWDDQRSNDSRQTAGYGMAYADDHDGPIAFRKMRGGDGYDAPDARRRRRRRGRGDAPTTRLGLAGWVSIALTCIMVIGTLTAYKLYRDAVSMIYRTRSTDELDKNRPVNQTGAINVLLVGSDTRAGENKKYGQYLVNDGERTDTIMLLHVSPNRDEATLLSFPRDSMVMIPACKNTRTGAVLPQRMGMINSAFSEGGMICTRRTIEALTKIRIDHFVKVDFTGFKNIVNALGGIQICLPQAVNDPKSKLNLSAGRHVVRGEEALAYVRLRHGLGDGSDISRIKRQQVFIAQVVKKATSSALLTDLGKLQAFIGAATRSLTMDDGLNTEALLQIAQSTSKLSAKGFKATTVPWEPYVADKNRVQWKQPEANNLFDAIRSDTEVTPTASPAASVSASARPSAPAVTKPQQVKVQVFNGTNTAGKGQEVAEALAAQGFKVISVGNALKPDGTDQPKTLVRYTGPGWDYAKVLVGKLLNPVTPDTGKIVGPVTPFTPSSPPPDAPKGRTPGPTIQLVIGSDWQGVRVPLQVGDNAVTANTNICSN